MVGVQVDDEVMVGVLVNMQACSSMVGPAPRGISFGEAPEHLLVVVRLAVDLVGTPDLVQVEVPAQLKPGTPKTGKP